jgi:Cys-tRNA synthase (O-phospho-L-seryl-tRNA:Cys-tRNA synthase)
LKYFVSQNLSGIFTYHVIGRIRIAAFQEEAESSGLVVGHLERTSGLMDLGTHGKQHHEI